jgi:hypothetical protein
LQTTGRDLIVAMRWGKWASRGLFQPNASTAPVMLLLLEQYCRQQVPFKQIRETIIDRTILKSEGFIAGMNLTGYYAAAAREMGYREEDLRSSGYSKEEIRGAGCVLQVRRRDDGPRYTATQLRQLGYRAAELRAGGYSMEEIQKAHYSLREIKDCKVPVSDMRLLGYTAMEMKEVGYRARELRAGGYSMEEIRGARYSYFDLLFMS